MSVSDDKAFSTKIARNIAVVKFGSLWDAACRALEQPFKALSEEFAGRALFIESDVNGNPELAASYGVRAIPTVLIVADGKVVSRVTGSVSKSYLREKIKKALKLEL